MKGYKTYTVLNTKLSKLLEKLYSHFKEQVSLYTPILSIILQYSTEEIDIHRKTCL